MTTNTTQPPVVLRLRRRLLRILPAATALAVLLAACATADADPTSTDDDVTTSPTIPVTAVDFGFRLPEQIPPGSVRLSLTNEGLEPHHAQLLRLNDGVGEAEFRDVVASLDDAAIAGVAAFVGGTGTVSPGGTSDADGMPLVEEGNYALLCFIPGAADGLPHHSKGMIATFEVGNGDAVAATIDSSPEIGLQEYGFTTPDGELTAGTYTVTNNGSEVHEMNMLRLADGAGVDDVLAFTPDSEGPPPFTNVGGANAILPGARTQVALDVEPGQYVLVCYVPTFSDGIPHIAKGMVQEVTVVDS